MVGEEGEREGAGGGVREEVSEGEKLVASREMRVVAAEEKRVAAGGCLPLWLVGGGRGVAGGAGCLDPPS